MGPSIALRIPSHFTDLGGVGVQGLCDRADLSGHAGRCDDSSCAALGHGAAAEGHVDAVADGAVFFEVHVGGFYDGEGFAG